MSLEKHSIRTPVKYSIESLGTAGQLDVIQDAVINEHEE